jgi:hypothetical protein
MVTREWLHELIDELPEQQTEEVARLLEDLKQQASAALHVSDGEDDFRLPTAAEIPAAYGPPKLVRLAPPIKSIDDLVGNFWPEDESAEEFDATIRRWRTEGGRGRLPD